MFDMIGMNFFKIFLTLDFSVLWIILTHLSYKKYQKKNSIKDCAIGNLQTQNKDLKKQVNELSSKLNKV